MRHLEHTNSMSQPVRRKKWDHLPWLVFAAVATVATSRIVFGVPEIVGAAMREETLHDLGELSTAQGPDPYAEGDRILTRGAVDHPAEPSGSAVASQNPWKPITFSVYSDYYEGRRAADGSRFSQKAFTCASNTHKLGTVLELRLNSTDHGVCTVKVTDRMAKRFTGKRIDLSRAAWDYLTYKKAPGLAKGEWRVAK